MAIFALHVGVVFSGMVLVPGHSWGSHHDPADEPNCRSVYLMYEFAQDGSLESHRVCLVDIHQEMADDLVLNLSVSFDFFATAIFALQ